ncbi:histone H4 transcription factor [Schistocerca cancellata]|uniref:histone H4 transcription factor n=1 Tax=Schistocerca cancellata TaxID=274614 RepID=UPI002118A27E|nr:histone H4 transcription factor [Schistocerca cancellata]
MCESTKLVTINDCSPHKGVKRKFDGSCSPQCVFDRVLASEMNADASREDGTSLDISDDEYTSEHGNDCLPLENNELNTFRRSDALENCRNWVNQSQELYPTKSIRTKSNKEERQVTATVEEQDVDSPDGNESDSKTSNGKCSMLIKGKRLWLKEQVLHLVCEWKNCAYEIDDVETFVRHVSMHIPDLDIRINEDGKEVFVCLWALCEFETEEPKEIVRHVNFHSYHTKLKSIGAMLMKHFKALVCTYDGEGRNTIPDGEEYMCYWADCDRAFNNMQIFLYHVQSHVQCNPRGRVVKGGVPCQWEGCTGVFVSVYKLSDHVRTHTQEKIVGCPTCGATYASRTKFLDHCKRQVTVQAGEGYKCSHCNKLFPSERLFHEHVRHRVNFHKCRFCDMTCPTPSALVLHVRFRHLDERLFKCVYCDSRAKTLADIRVHMHTHFSGNLYHCSVEGCNVSCRSRVGMKKHIARVHEGQHEPLYCCHLCDRQYQRGASLTKHVFREHDLRWPSGHKRFRYRQHEDGLYRLQLVRYESLEVTQMISGDSSHDEQQMTLSNKRYHLRKVPSRTQNEPASFEVYEVLDEKKFEENNTGSNKVLITISDVDHSGNVIQSEVIEAEELTMLPSMTLLDDTN